MARIGPVPEDMRIVRTTNTVPLMIMEIAADIGLKTGAGYAPMESIAGARLQVMPRQAGAIAGADTMEDMAAISY